MNDRGRDVELAVMSVREGKPFYVLPYKEPKVWGVGGIGEYWYGAEPGNKSSTARIGGLFVPMDELITADPAAVLGRDVVRIFGPRMPLVKILTPNGRLSVQFHDAKNELWIVTAAAGPKPVIILGFSRGSVAKYGDRVADEYRRALENYGKALNTLIDVLEDNGFKAELDKTKDAEAAGSAAGKNAAVAAALKTYRSADKEMRWFYNLRPVRVGDVVPIPSGTMHALGAGVEIVEPQIAGPTQSLEDGATYPVRYYFPGFERAGAQKKLDVDRVGEMKKEVVSEAGPLVIKEEKGCKVERLPGGFEDKGLEVHRITLKAGSSLDKPAISSFHNLVALEGRARVILGGASYEIPRASGDGEMLLIPSSACNYRVEAVTGAVLIDTFTPVQKAENC